MTDAELAARIEALASGPATNALALCDAAFALGGGLSRVFGEPVPANAHEHHARALVLLRAWLPQLDGDVLQQLAWRVEDRKMPVDVAARQAELANARAAQQTSAVAADAAVLAAAMPAELAAEIDRDPDDEEGYRVLGDALERAGDPRGELIALQLAQDATDGTAESDRAAAARFEAHRDRFLGPLAEMFDGEPWTARVRWQWGFIRSASLGIHDPADYASAGRLAGATQILLRHPSGRFLRELAIGLAGFAGHRNDLADVAAAIAAHAPPSLDHLVLGDFKFPDDSDISAYWVGDLAPIWELGAQLAHVELQGAGIGFPADAIDAPALRHLEIRTGGLLAETARAIAQLRAPDLAHLRVYFGSSSYGATATLDDARALLARRDLPALRTLGLCNAEFADALCDATADAPLLASVTRLDLSLGTMTDAGAARLLALHRLEHLDVSRNYLSADACDELEAVFGDRVVTERQDDDDTGDDRRYVSVSE